MQMQRFFRLLGAGLCAMLMACGFAQASEPREMIVLHVMTADAGQHRDHLAEVSAKRAEALAKWDAETARLSTVSRSDMRTQSNGMIFSTIGGVVPITGELLKS